QPLAGIPVTPSVVLLGATGSANLADANGFVCLTVQAANPAGWPQLFGVVVKQNQTTPANFDLSVVYIPATAGPGTSTEVTLERFTNLSFKAADPNYVGGQINSFSRLIRVPSSYVPPATGPSSFPTAPTMLPNTGTVNLQNTGSPPVTYLTLQATTPTGWPQAFGVLAQAFQQGPSVFNLAIVYYPPSGSEGVTLPVTLEQFTGLSLVNIARRFNSRLVTVKSFSGAPDLSVAAADLMNFD